MSEGSPLRRFMDKVKKSKETEVPEVSFPDINLLSSPANDRIVPGEHVFKLGVSHCH